VHTSGHGHREELKLMLNLTRPRYLMPFHGDFKRIHLHAQLAESVGISADRVFRGENGLPLELDAKGARFGKKVQAGMVFVDGLGVGDPGDAALHDRRALSRDGIVFIVAIVSEEEDEIVASSEVILRGVPAIDGVEALTEQLRDAVEATLNRAVGEQIHDPDLLQQLVHDDLAKLVFQLTKRRPMIVPVIVEV